MASGLAALQAGAGQILGRTVFVQTNTPNGIPIPLIVLDVVKEEKPDFTAEITDHPVELGPEVSDHVQLKNPVLRLKGTISSTPLDLSVAVGNVLAGGYQAFTNAQFRTNLLNSGVSQGVGLVGAALQGNAGNPGASAAAGAVDAISRTILTTVYENAIPFDVITRRQRYKNMLIQRLSFPRTEETGYALEFEIELKQVILVSPLKTTKGTVAENVIPGGSSSTNIGSQSTQAVNSQTFSAIQSSDLGSAPGMVSKFSFLG